MNEGYFIGQGDKTTCGGKVLDGDGKVNMFGLQHAREGAIKKAPVEPLEKPDD